MSDFNRRAFFKRTLGAAAVLASAKTLAAAAVCETTPSQTSGPFVPDDFPFAKKGDEPPYIQVADHNADLTLRDDSKVDGRPKGQIIYLRGQVVDQDCKPVSGAHVYLWQADDNG